MIPPRPILERQKAEMTEVDAVMEGEQEMMMRYLQYECNYKKCKYQNPKITWGHLITNDYNHFFELMKTEVPVESNTFLALSSQLKPGDRAIALAATRTRDTPAGRNAQCDEYLSFLCTHKGRMNGKDWRTVRNEDYSYFTWAIGNTMSRDTKTFGVFRDCLKPSEQQLVDSKPKGQVKVKKGLKWPGV